MGKYIIDTNLIARILIQDSPEQLSLITKFIEDSVSNNDLLYVDNSVVFELVYILSGNIYQLSRMAVKDKLLSLIELDCFTFDSIYLIEKSLDIYVKHNLDIVDCYLITKSLSENYIFKSFDTKANKVFGSIAKGK